MVLRHNKNKKREGLYSPEDADIHCKISKWSIKLNACRFLFFLADVTFLPNNIIPYPLQREKKNCVNYFIKERLYLKMKGNNV